ncbi:MAG: 6-pyruvoyl-tetrahydropterin synthase-related protein, partial [Patescibacteria group bacterium]
MKLSEIKSFNKRFLIEIFVIALLTLPAIWSLIRPGFFTMYDDMQVIRVQQMDVCVKDGQIPCRWVPDLGYGYGYPIYQYYAPLPYYLMEGVHLLGISFIDSVKVGFALSVVFSALFMYLLAKKFFSSQASFAVVALYTLVPFRAASVYVRGAMGEAWGLATLPMVILGFENYLEKRDKTSLSLFGISIFLFLISHNLT